MPQLPKKPFLRQHLSITLPPLLMAGVRETSPLLGMESLKERFSVAARMSTFVWFCGWFGFLQLTLVSIYIIYMRWGCIGMGRGEGESVRDVSCRRPSQPMALRGRLIVRRRSSRRFDVRGVRRRCRASDDGVVRMSLTCYFSSIEYFIKFSKSFEVLVVCFNVVYLID